MPIGRGGRRSSSGPAEQVERAGDLGDVSAVADLTAGGDRPGRAAFLMALVSAAFLVGKPTE
jgi:hypothetical protein